MSIRAIIFDLGGVLVRTEDYGPRDALAKKHSLTRLELEEIVFGGGTPENSGRRTALGEFTTAEHWVNVCRALGLEADQSDALADAFWGGDRPDAELMDYIRALQPHYTTALLSNAFDDLREVMTNHWKIIDAFDQVFISAELGLAKPDPRIYERVLAELGVQPEQAVFVDDFEHNIAAARAAGMHGIRFLSPQQARAELDALLAQEKEA